MSMTMPKLLHTSECEDTAKAQRTFSDSLLKTYIIHVLMEVDKCMPVNIQLDLFISLSLFPSLSLTPKPLIFGIPFTVFTGYHSGNRAGVKPSLNGMKGCFCEQVDERGACSGHMDWRRAIERGAPPRSPHAGFKLIYSDVIMIGSKILTMLTNSYTFSLVCLAVYHNNW